MKKCFIIFFTLFFLSSLFSPVSAYTPQQKIIWYNPRTFSCTTRASFDNLDLIRIENPWVNQTTLAVCSLLDSKYFNLIQRLLVITLIPVLIGIASINLARKKPKSQSLKIIAITIVTYLIIFFWIGLVDQFLV